MNLPTPAAARKKYLLLQAQGGKIEEMEPLEQVIINYLPLSTWRFHKFSRSLKKIMLLYLSQNQTPEMKKMVADFIEDFAEPERQQELARLMRQAINQAEKEKGGN